MSKEASGWGSTVTQAMTYHSYVLSITARDYHLKRFPSDNSTPHS
jgi:hypothetical protein